MAMICFGNESEFGKSRPNLSLLGGGLTNTAIDTMHAYNVCG